MTGVLIKNAEALEVLEKVDTLVVDKTGTLTEGRPRLVSLEALPGFEEAEVLGLAASLERASEHPLAEAIVAGAREKGLALSDVDGFRSLTGRGVLGRIGGREVVLGNQKLFTERDIPTGDLIERADALRREGQTVMFAALDGRAAGLVGVADPIKASTPEAIEMLHREGVRLVMLTGDNRTTAEAVARRLNIDEVEAEVLPEEKGETVKRLQAEGRVVAMAETASTTPRRWPGPGGDRHGDGERRGHGERRRDTGPGGPSRHRQGPRAQPGDDAQHPAEPLLHVRL